MADIGHGGAAGGADGSDALSATGALSDGMSDGMSDGGGAMSDRGAEGDFEWPVPEGEQGIGQPPDALVRAMALARGQATDSEDEAESAEEDEDGEVVIADDAEMEALARPAKKRSLLEQREEEEKEFAEYPDEIDIDERGLSARERFAR